jgi:FKBP-type peptidyl-prolyl cis-trans isomerase (trigger factor)
LLQVEYQRDEDTLRLTVTVPASRCKAAYNETMKRIRSRYNIPGFRNAEKVPTDMLINACGGQKQFNMVCVEEVLHTTIEEVCLHSLCCPCQT